MSRMCEKGTCRVCESCEPRIAVSGDGRIAAECYRKNEGAVSGMRLGCLMLDRGIRKS